MADELSMDQLTALRDKVNALLVENNTAIEFYRGNFATPTDIASMRFWCQGEFDRIQSGFASTDQVVKILAEVADVIAQILINSEIGSPGDSNGGVSPPGNGGGFVPSTFAGAGSTGYVPDPITESNRALSDTGEWRRATKLFIQLNQPTVSESAAGDLWLVST